MEPEGHLIVGPFASSGRFQASSLTSVTDPVQAHVHTPIIKTYGAACFPSSLTTTKNTAQNMLQHTSPRPPFRMTFNEFFNFLKMKISHALTGNQTGNLSVHATTTLNY